MKRTNDAGASGIDRTSAGNAWGCRDLAGGVINQSDVLGSGIVTINNSDRDVNIDIARRGFSSQHPGGAQFALADGSVRFISETIQTAGYDANGQNTGGTVDSTYEYLLAIGDGNPVGDY